jgi:hypothetical protein
MFLFNLLPGSVAASAASADHGVVKFLDSEESTYGSGDETEEKSSVRGISAIMESDLRSEGTEKEEGVVVFVTDVATTTTHLRKSVEKEEQTRRKRKAAPSLTEIVESNAWHALRQEFDQFCASIPEDGTWHLDEDEIDDLKSQLQVRLVDSLLGEEEGDDWKTLKRDLLLELNSPLRERHYGKQLLEESRPKSEVQLEQDYTTTPKEEVVMDASSKSSLTMRRQLLPTLLTSSSPMTPRTPSPCRIRPQSPPQTPPHNFKWDQAPNSFKAVHFKNTAECLFHAEPSRPSALPSPALSTSSVSLPQDAFSRHDDDSDEEDSICKEDLLQSSEDEGMYNSTAPTSAFTSANSTPEKPTTIPSPALKLLKASLKLKAELGVNAKPTEEAESWVATPKSMLKTPGVQTVAKHRTLDIDVPTAIDDVTPISQPTPSCRRTSIPRRARVDAQRPVKDSPKAGGFKPIFNLNKMTPTREQIAAHINFANPVYVGKLSIGLQRPCLQCVMANLPCDRGWKCSRCVRHGHGEMCLVQRDLGIQEKLIIGIEQYPYIALVRGRDEGDEIWEKKRALEAELLDILQKRCDRLNWVLPGDRRRKGGCLRRKRIETRAFEVDGLRGKMWVADIVVEDDMRVPL